jgi:hypothetical protein
MKKTVILLIALTLSIFVMAQEKTKVKELGLTFRNLDEFGFSYKVGTEQSLWRFNAMSISGSNTDAELNNNNNADFKGFGFSFKVGKEYRKLISEKVEFRYGADLSFGYSYSKSTGYNTEDGYEHEEKENHYSPGINLVLGLNYKINDQFIFGAEIMPYLNYYISETTSTTDTFGKHKSDHSNFKYGFDSSSVLLNET